MTASGVLAASDLPRTVALSPRVQVAEYASSTNTELIEAAAADPDAYPHLSVLLTLDQRSGRGRLDRVWQAPAGASLALSAVVRADGIQAAEHGWIPLAAGLAMQRALAAQLPEREVRVKWPNDVLVDGQKICGILVQATLVPGLVVIGAGVNTAMTEAQLPVPTATSFAVLGETCDLDLLISAYLRELDAALTGLARFGSAQRSGLQQDVAAACATIGQRIRVMLPDDAVLTGTAVGIDVDGRLLVRASGDGESIAVSAGDVVHVRPAG